MCPLDRLHLETRTKKGEAFSRLTLTLDPDRDGGLLAEMFAIPQGECRFAEYVKQDDLVIFMTVQNFAGHLELILDQLAKPEFAEMMEGLPLDENGDLAMPGFNPRKDLLPLLSGELDIALFEGPEGGMMNPMQLPVFLVLGTRDGHALRDLILEIATLFGGEGAMAAIDMIRSQPPEKVGDFEITAMPFGGAYAVSEDYFILGLTDGPLRGMLASAEGDLDVPTGRSWMYMNGRNYGKTMQPIMEMAAMANPGGGESDLEQEMMEMMYSNLFEHIDSEIIQTTSGPGRLVVESQVEGSVTLGLYSMLHEFLMVLPEVVEQQRAKDGAHNVIPVLDAALTRYGREHGGLFPADPIYLVDEGYLDEFPLETAVPAGEYLEGGYTYHPLFDDEGQVAGYFLFVYGGGEGTGHDVYTPGNVLAPGNFVVDSDGTPDGVSGFCFDGLALKQIEIWREK